MKFKHLFSPIKIGSMILSLASSGVNNSTGTLFILTRPFPFLTLARAIDVFLFPLVLTTLTT